MPRKQMVRYATVPSTAVSGVDITETMERFAISRMPVSTTDKPIKRVMVLPI